VHGLFVCLAQEVLARLGVGDVAIDREHQVVGGQRLCGREKPKFHRIMRRSSSLKCAGLLPQLDILLHRDLFGHPVVGHAFFVMRARPRILHRQYLVRVGHVDGRLLDARGAHGAQVVGGLEPKFHAYW
jgi:hypothetical protein